MNSSDVSRTAMTARRGELNRRCSAHLSTLSCLRFTQDEKHMEACDAGLRFSKPSMREMSTYCRTPESEDKAFMRRLIKPILP